MPGIAAISYHVDYWDYLGWKDTLAQPRFSRRQYNYAHARGDMDVYTPQIIVEGQKHFVGSDRAAVLAGIQRAQAEADYTALKLSAQDKELVAEIAAVPGEVSAMLWLMPIVPKTSVKIEKGENAGQEITYYNVVGEMVPAGNWNGEAKRVAMPKDGVLAPDSTGCIAILQRGKGGPILATAAWGEIGS